MRIMFLLLCFIAFLPATSSARPLKTCLFESTGKIRVKRRCNAAKGQTEVSAEVLQGIAITQVGPQGPEGPQGPVGPQGETGPKGDSRALCFAYIGFTGGVRSYGGEGTTNVVVSHTADSGVYDITCQGNYPGISSSNNVARFATIQTGGTDSRTITINSFGTYNSSTMTVQVRTFNPAGVATDYSHSIMVVGETS